MGIKQVVACVFAAMLSAVLLNCTGNADFERLPRADQDLWQRCFEAMRPSMCGPNNDAVYVGICGRRNGNDYIAQPSSDARREWAIAHGCPPSMVNPRAYVSGGER